MRATKPLLTGILAAAASTAFAEDGPAAYPDRQAFFETLVETLPGRWEGRFASGSFDNPTSDWRPTRVDYYVTSGGTALVENYLDEDGSVSMTTVYHMDNNDIRATHYCGARNHPRMVTRGFDAATRTLSLGFVDVANLKTPDTYHSREIELSLVDEDNFHVTYLGIQDGEESSQIFALKRVED